MAQRSESESLETYLRSIISCAKEAKSAAPREALQPVLVLQTPLTPLTGIQVLASSSAGEGLEMRPSL